MSENKENVNVISVTEKMIRLFSDYRDYFGIGAESSLEAQCDFEEFFLGLICEYNGKHNLAPDQCGKPEHDYCTVCNISREDLDGSKDKRTRALEESSPLGEDC